MRLDQSTLYEKYIKPNEGQLLASIHGCRQLVDEVFQEKMREDFLQNPERNQYMKGVQDIQKYPNGHCKEIRDFVFEVLSRSTAPKYLKDFQKKGGIIRKEWMVYKGEENGFANVIRIGDKILDPAFEELSGKSTKVGVTQDGGTSPYKMPDIESIVDTAESYLEESCYSSHHILGQLSFLFPIVSFRKDGVISFLGNATKTSIVNSRGIAGSLWREKHEEERGKIGEEHYKNLRRIIGIMRVWSSTEPVLFASLLKDRAKYVTNQQFLEFLYFIEHNLMRQESVRKLHESERFKKYLETIAGKSIEQSILFIHWNFIKGFEDLFNTFIHFENHVNAESETTKK